MQNSSVKVFNCPSCSASLTLRAKGHSISIFCQSCGAVIDVKEENYTILATAAQKKTYSPLIPLGRRGKLHGVLWEVIGFVKQCDSTGIYTWGEYLLFNPIRGFRWLTEFDGHWNYVIQTRDKPSIHGNHKYGGKEIAHYETKDYHLFHEGVAKVIYVLGEFYWRIREGDQVNVKDYISPPEMLSRESNGGEIVWSIAEYVEPEIIKKAFDVQEDFPLRFGVAPNQPCTVSSYYPTIKKYWIGFAALALLIQFLTIALSSSESVFNENFSYLPGAPIQVTPSFQLKNGRSNLLIEVQSPVSNSWFELQGELINDETGESYEFEEGVEFYSGSDSDGSWTEGSQRNSVTLSAIPEGRYHLNLQPSGPPLLSQSTLTPPSPYLYSVQIFRKVPNWSNFFLILTFISIFPIYVYWKRKSFEQSRWSTSDFSPFWLHRDEY